MIRKPRWLRPAIATASVVALGAASIAVGSMFAAPGAPATAATAEFPVLQPIGYGATMPEAPAVEDLAGSDGSPGFVTSPEQGTRRVAVDDDGLPHPESELRDVVETLADLPDPGAGGWDFPPVSDGGDPCSPADGSEVDGCPDGIHGATFSILSPGNLWGHFGTNPAATRTSPYELVFCPPAEHGPSSLPFGIATSAPGTITLRYWPRGDESAVRSMTLASSEGQTADWESHLATEDSFEGDWTMVQHCGVLDGLDRYGRYDGEFTIHDILDREVVQSIRTPFGLPDDRTAPDFRVTPLGANAILLSAPHREGTQVRFNVQVVDPGDAADCADRSDRLPVVGSGGPRTTEVSADYLAEHDYLPRYTKRTTLGVYVPAGSTVLACAGVYEDDRPGWEWLEAQHRYSVVLQTPDTPRPVITVGAVELDADHVGVPVSAFAVWDGTSGDLRCTLWASGSSGSCGGGSHDITRGDVWVTTTAGTGDNLANWSAVLPLGGIECYDGCVTPDTAWYSVPVKLQERPGEQCGSGLVGPCPATIIGTAVLRVDWIAGTHGGADTWTFSPPTSESVEHVLDPLPQMDWLVEPTVTTDDATRSAIVSFVLNVDREVDYTARLVGDCERPSARFEASGHTARGTVVNFTGACLGESYAIDVQLTDAEGNTNLFGEGGTPWPFRYVATPGFEYDVVLGQHLGLREAADQVKIRRFEVRVDGQGLERILPPHDCIYGNDLTLTPAATTEDARLAETVTVEVIVQLAESNGSSDGTIAFCNAGTDSGTPVYRFTQDVSIDDLLRGVTIGAPDDAPYLTEVTLRAVPPRP